MDNISTRILNEGNKAVQAFQALRIDQQKQCYQEIQIANAQKTPLEKLSHLNVKFSASKNKAFNDILAKEPSLMSQLEPQILMIHRKNVI